jgi:hypothetical protein
MRITTWRSLGRILVVGALVSVAGPGCKKLQEKLTGGSSTSEVGAKKPEFTDEGIAFMFGRKYAFACLYAQLDKPAEASGAISAARTLAGALGVAEPVLPAKSDGFRALRSKAIPDELAKKKNAKVSAIFSLGVAVTDAWFGALLGSDTGPIIAEIEGYAKAAGTPESVWKSQLDGIKTKATDDKLKKLAVDLEAHYKG